MNLPSQILVSGGLRFSLLISITKSPYNSKIKSLWKPQQDTWWYRKAFRSPELLGCCALMSTMVTVFWKVKTDRAQCLTWVSSQWMGDTRQLSYKFAVQLLLKIPNFQTMQCVIQKSRGRWLCALGGVLGRNHSSPLGIHQSTAATLSVTQKGPQDLELKNWVLSSSFVIWHKSGHTVFRARFCRCRFTLFWCPILQVKKRKFQMKYSPWSFGPSDHFHPWEVLTVLLLDDSLTSLELAPAAKLYSPQRAQELSKVKES